MGERRQFLQSRGLSASYSQLRRNGVQNSNFSRLSVRNQGATPDIVVTQPPMYTFQGVQEPFFDDFAVQEFRTGLIPNDQRRQPFQSLLYYGESSEFEGELETPLSTQLPLGWSSSWLARGDESLGRLESAVSETLRRSSASHELDNAVSSRVHELENVVSGGVHELENVVSGGVHELENVVSGDAHQPDNVASAGVQELDNVVSSGLETKRRRTNWLNDEEDQATKEERKVQKRKESNRLSAQRCREKKKLGQQQVEAEMEKLRNENFQLRQNLCSLQEANAELERRICELEALAQSMLSSPDRQPTDPNRGSTPDFIYNMERRYL